MFTLQKNIVDTWITYILILNGAEIAYIVISEPYSGSRGKIIRYIWDIYVPSEFRGMGYATKLWNMIKEEITVNTDKILIQAAEFIEREGRLINLYSKWGFSLSDSNPTRMINKIGKEYRVYSMKLIVK